ncbi:polysaccharide pyruvyl transferase family protein [Streptomyces sp. AJS327]|uniref:polysaccharide pyruvyl transferase family protein n=1 Tax=Streptomyces sp. AJS327 TaxID=2545265 RepID=UPI0015DF058A|nr:polysaccharide pyruvyl transferase family protein [Streptomyces sp. AJS327]MBA0049504.1 polysaccharide pyruvyl transferase family protein [Streptomyces sp. AJS327]
MKQILIRSGKSPFHVATPEQVIHQDLIGTNSGNLLFSDAAHKLLLTKNTEVSSNGIRTNSSAARAAEINEQYDVFVIPLANAFRPSFRDALDRLTKLIEQLTIPVVVLGVGAQAGTDFDTEAISSLRPSVKRFARAVLDRSPSIGVRGEMTAEYLRDLGFRDVDVIGCPSMFLYGDTFPALDTRKKLTTDSRLAINISRGANRVGEIAAIARNAYRRYPNITYYAQNLVDAELLFWGDTSAAAGLRKVMPTAVSHELLRDGRTRVPMDSAPWLAELRDHEFSFGTRIHGNIAALLAGTPSVVLCHDSRTLELCRYFEIPYQMLAELPPDVDPAELYEKADFSGLAAGHQERFERLVTFLDKHGLENTFTHGDQGAEFDARVAALKYPEPLQLWDGSDDGSLGYRISWLREQARRGQQGVERELETASKSISALQTRNDELEMLSTALLRRAASAEKRLDALERRDRPVRKTALRTASAVRGRLRRVVGRGR